MVLGQEEFIDGLGVITIDGIHIVHLIRNGKQKQPGRVFPITWDTLPGCLYSRLFCVVPPRKCFNNGSFMETPPDTGSTQPVIFQSLFGLGGVAAGQGNLVSTVQVEAVMVC